MVTIIRALIVEDQPNEQEAWKNVIDLRNADSTEVTLAYDFATSLFQAEERLNQRRYDVAIVDIRLDRDGVLGANTDGNSVINRISQRGLMLVAAFTGERSLVESTTVKTFTKGSADENDGTDAVLNWLVEQVPLIHALRSAHSHVEGQLAQLFHGSVWPRWKKWVENAIDGDVALPLARHLTSHVHAALLERQQHRVHPEEWYFIPPIREGIRTGDVVQPSDGAFEIVVSPRCDLSSNSKVTHILVAKCTSVAAEWNELELDLRTKQTALAQATSGNHHAAEKALNRARESLRKFTQHNGNTNSVHFLPRAWLKDGTEFGPVNVNFDQLRSIAKISPEGERLIHQRVATIAPEFLPSLVERLGSYLSRFGTPEYSHPEK